VFLLRSAKKIFLLIILLLLISECTGEKIIISPSGITYIDNKTGKGKKAEPGDTVVVHFKAWLLKDAQNILCETENDTDAVILGDSYSAGKPIEFRLEENNFIMGSDEGISGMKKGGIRTMLIPSQVLYKNASGDSPPGKDVTIRLIVELLQIKQRLND